MATMTVAKALNAGLRRALDGFDMVVEAGQVHGFLGPNGAGKSTTVHMLTTLLPPMSGTATVGGFDVARQAVLRGVGQRVPHHEAERLLGPIGVGKQALGRRGVVAHDPSTPIRTMSQDSGPSMAS